MRKTQVQLEELGGKYEPIPTDDIKSHDRGWVESIRWDRSKGATSRAAKAESVVRGHIVMRMQ